MGGYDWRAAEREMNRWPQFREEVHGLRIHFLHARTGGLPLLVTHGWPGSFVEMLRLLPLLVDAGFDVALPSLPGYGFSPPPERTGVNAEAIADAWAALMTRLGYERFGAQGGDIGAAVSTWLALRHPRRLAGLHLNYIPGSYRPDSDAAPAHRGRERVPRLGRCLGRPRRAATRTSSAPGRTRSASASTIPPAGLLAWIGEKLRGWSADFEKSFTLDDVLTHVTLYWVTRTATSSVRLYYENRLRPVHLREGERVRVPTAIARFPLEVPMPPLPWIKRGYDVERYTEMPSGGHFAAWEEPALLAADLPRSSRTGPEHAREIVELVRERDAPRR